MTVRVWLALSLTTTLIILSVWSSPTPACSPVSPSGKPVVNADQTVIIIWDAGSGIQHFIRLASFQSEADDFGFLVPSPTQPELDESGNEVFPYLLKLTEPEKQKARRPSGGMSCGCSSSTMTKSAAVPEIRVLQEKLVAGFNAVVLEARSADALVRWLKDNGYAFSPEVQAWAQPYIAAGWKITALKVAKDAERKDRKTVAASSLRMSFKTDRPVFPYREPDPSKYAAALGAKDRLLRIYFLAEARYRGELTREAGWTGKVAWANKLKPEDRTKVLEMLKLPKNTGPAEWWLTEFEDNWPYQPAPADVYFSPDSDQGPVKRPPIVQYVASPFPTDVTAYALVAALILPPVLRRLRCGRQSPLE